MTTQIPTQHVLDPLTRAEIEPFIALIKADARIGEQPRFWGVYLDETKALAGAPGDPRPVRTVVMNPAAHKAWEVRGWTAGAAGAPIVEGWTDIDPRRPGTSSDEARAIAKAARESPLLKEALAKRGIHDTSLIWVDPESITGFDPEEFLGRRLSWGSVWFRTSWDDNGYARPIAGLVPIIDQETLEVVKVEDYGIVPISLEQATYTPGEWGPDRHVAPLEIVQPEGPGFAVDGRYVRWQNWSFRIGFTHREGLVLHDVSYHDGDRVRSVLKRASINEMYVPYLDNGPTAFRKNFFDWGEYGAGPLTASLELGCDCLGEIRYFDAEYLDGYGDVQRIANAICMHEEDAGILWKHVNTRVGSSEVRRARKLIISAFHTVANYDYGFYWTLTQDGMIELEVKLTGLMSVQGIAEGEQPKHGRLVAPGINSATHQHYFAVRLDTAIDGPRNRIVEVEAAVDPDEETNPWGNACIMVETPIESEKDGGRLVDPLAARFWRIESESDTNRMGDPTAYRLVLEHATQLFAKPGSKVIEKAPFVGKHVWATVADPEQRYIAGEYPNQGPLGEDGVTVWQQADRSLVNAELVVWPVVGVHHFPRPEQWPIMPVDKLRMRLEPDGFFDRNPSLDVPAAEGSAHCAMPAQARPAGVSATATIEGPTIGAPATAHDQAGHGDHAGHAGHDHHAHHHH